MEQDQGRSLPARATSPSDLSPVGSSQSGIANADLDWAIRIMLDAHRGQLDKGGQPYFLHPLRVMLACEGEQERIAAVLHDTVEDSAITFTDIRQMFGDTIMEAVQALTRSDGEEYPAFIERCAANPIARTVKLADLADNMNLERLNREPTSHDLRRHVKYAEAKNVLMLARHESAVGATDAPISQESDDANP